MHDAPFYRHSLQLLLCALAALPAIGQQNSGMMPAGMPNEGMLGGNLPLIGADESAPAVALPHPSQMQAPSQQAPERPKPVKRIVNRIAATVNGRPVTSNEVSFLLMPIGAQLATLYPRQGPEFQRQLTKAKKDIINELIERELVLGDFEEKGYQMRDSLIDQEVQRTIKETFNGSRDKFLENLKASGLTIRGFKDLTKRRMIVMAMRSSKYDQDIPPTPEEIRKEYQLVKTDLRDITKDQIKFKKIFIPMLGEDPASTPDSQLKLAELIADELKSGREKFADMAAKYSSDQAASKGGEWPVTSRSDLSPEFAAILFSSPEKTLIGPLIDPNGFSLIFVEHKTLASPPPLSQVKEQIDNLVRSKRSNERYKQWVNRLRQKAIVKTFI